MAELRRALERCKTVHERPRSWGVKSTIASLLVVIMSVSAVFLSSQSKRFDDGGSALSVALGGDPEVSWRAYQEAGERADRNKQFTEAEEMWKSAVAVAEKSFKQDDLRLARSLHDLAHHYHINKKDPRSAESIFRRVLEIRRTQLSPADRDMADIYGHLGSVYNDLGRYQEADRNLKHALEISEKVDTSLYLYYLNVLAEGLLNRDYYFESEQVYKKILVMQEEENGPESLESSDALENLGYLYFKQDQFDKAAPLFKRALEIRTLNKQDESSADYDYAWVLSRLGDCFREKRAYLAAENYFARSARAYGLLDDYGNAGEAFQKQADVQFLMGQNAIALGLYRKALEFRKQRQEEAPSELIATLLNLATVAASCGQQNQAESAINELRELSLQYPLQSRAAIMDRAFAVQKALNKSKSNGWIRMTSMIHDLIAFAQSED